MTIVQIKKQNLITTPKAFHICFSNPIKISTILTFTVPNFSHFFIVILLKYVWLNNIILVLLNFVHLIFLSFFFFNLFEYWKSFGFFPQFRTTVNNAAVKILESVPDPYTYAFLKRNYQEVELMVLISLTTFENHHQSTVRKHDRIVKNHQILSKTE